MEKTDNNIKGILQRSNPFKEKKCNREDCLVCTSGGYGQCRSQSVTYEIACKGCDSIYVGETSRSGYDRGKEHWNAFRSGNKTSVLKTHYDEKHQGAEQGFVMNITNTFKNDPMLRQITEAVKIRRAGKETMNGKTEWNTIRIPQAKIDF